MKAETQRALAQRLLALYHHPPATLPGEVYRNPIDNYVSKRRLAAELETLFRGPLVAGLSADLAEKNAYARLQVGDAPLLITRDDRGHVRALFNVCRHRGAPLVTAEYGVGRLVCPYHGWTYATDGSLESCSDTRAFAGLDTASAHIRAGEASEAHGVISFQRGVEATGERAWAQALATELDGYRLGAQTRLGHRRLRRRMNWKLVLDTFLEAYHVPHLHRDSLAPYFAGDLAVYDPFGDDGRLTVARRSLLDLDSRAPEDRSILPHATILYLLFPNTILIHQQDHIELVQAFPAWPCPDESDVLLSLYVPGNVIAESERRRWERNFEILVDVTEEDFSLGESIQRGFHAGAAEYVLYGRNEAGLAHFHATVARRVGDGETAC